MKKTIQTPSYQILIKDFESFTVVRNYKLGKGNIHKAAVTEFLCWMEERGINKIKDVTSNEVVKYFEYLIERPNQRREGTLAEKTIKLHLYALGLFMECLLENNAIQTGFYIPSYSDGFSKSRNTLSVEQVKILYAHCQNDFEKALLSLAYGCGLRRSELGHLNSGDVFFGTADLVVRKGKGDKRRNVPMSNSVIAYAKEYFTNERAQRLANSNKSSGAFFINPKGKRASGEYLNDTLKKIVEKTGNNELIRLDITLHCLRHSIANHLAENNAGLDFIRRFLGHSEINTTYIYAIKNKKRKPVITF